MPIKKKKTTKFNTLYKSNSKWIINGKHEIIKFKRKIYLLYDPEIPLLGINSREMKLLSTQNLYVKVYRNCLYNNQKLETVQMSSCGRMAKQTVMQSYNGILLSTEKE